MKMDYKVLWMIVCLIGTVDACTIPTDNRYINSNTTFCYGMYNVWDGSWDGAIIINASNVVLDCNGSILVGNGSSWGINNVGHDNVTIKNCNVMKYHHGIRIHHSNNNRIGDNNILNNKQVGIIIESSNSNRVIDNNISNNGDKSSGNAMGIYLFNSSNNALVNNVIRFNINNGMGIHLSSFDNNNNTIANNIVNSNEGEGMLIQSDNNILINNTVNSNGWEGIFLQYASNNILINNSINSNGGNGIWMTLPNNTLIMNTVCNNVEYDIYSDYAGDSGSNNTCGVTYQWNDNGAIGCTHSCTTDQCTLKGDSDCDGVVSDFELLAYINQWVQGLVSDFNLLEAIDNWAS